MRTTVGRPSGLFMRSVLMSMLLLVVMATSVSARATRIDSYDCYGEFCLSLKGVLQWVQTPTGRIQIVSNARAEAWVYDGAGNVTWADKNFANQHYMINEDGSVTFVMSQVYFSVSAYAGESPSCFAYVSVVRDDELVVQNVTRDGCGRPS